MHQNYTIVSLVFGKIEHATLFSPPTLPSFNPHSRHKNYDGIMAFNYFIGWLVLQLQCKNQAFSFLINKIFDTI